MLEIDWIKIQNERSDGVSVAQLAKTYKVSQPTIYAHTKAPTNGNPGRAPRTARLARVVKASPAYVSGQFGDVLTVKAPRTNGTRTFAQVIAELEADREKIDAAIAALKALER
jgi:hypothetical protein